jgi:hypothetical protein
MSLARSKSRVSFAVELPFICLLKELRADSVKRKSLLSGLYFTGLLKTMLQVLSYEMLAPSTRVP